MPDESQVQPSSIDLHAPLVGNPDAGRSQSDDDEKIVKMVEHLFEEARSKVEKYHPRWLENYKAFVGDMWEQKRPSYRHSEVLNFIFSEIHSTLALMTDIRPQVEAIPEDPEDYAFAEAISKVIVSKWDRDAYNLVLAEAILDSSIYGTSIGGVDWDEKEADGLGDYDFQTKDIFSVYPDPYARDINHKTCGYYIEAEPTDPAVLRAEYKEVAHLIKPDLGGLSSLSQRNSESYVNDDVRFRSAVDRRIMVQDPQYAGSRGDRESVLKVTCYYKDGEVIREKFRKSDGTEAEQFKLKYPNGRKIVIAGKVKLEDSPMEIPLIPRARLVDYLMPREFWGMGEVDIQLTPNRIINKLVSYLLDVMIISGNPVWIIDTTSEVDPDELFNAPGAVVEKAPGSEVRREAGVQLQPFIFQTLQYFINTVQDKISGINDATRGATFSGQSGLAIESLQEAAQTKIRQKNRNMESFLSRIGQIKLEWILAKFTAPRVVRITNNPEDSKFFRVSVSNSPDGQRVVTTEEAIISENGGVSYGAPKQFTLKGRLDVRFKTGTQLPVAKAKRQQLAKELFELGIYDAEQLLEDLDIPNKEKVLARYQERQAKLAQAQAQGLLTPGGQNGNAGAGGPGAPAGPGGPTG